MKQTIAAISTSTGAGAISIIRLSGANAFTIAEKLFSGDGGFSKLKDRYMYFNTLKYNGNVLDDALVTKFSAPASFTGENMVEISCHGGAFIPASILSALIECGARPAENGEFTKRAFLNGKLELSAAEGIADMINAESQAEVNAGYNLLSGGLDKTINPLYDRLIDLLADIEAALDYPEEELITIDKAGAKKTITDILGLLEALSGTYRLGKLIKSGINVVIAGDTNAGKSSLLNALSGIDRAIVTDIAGTTTDTVTETFLYRGIKINITDTAGIRDTANIIEKKGVERAKTAIECADIVIAVTDNTVGSKLPEYIRELLQNKNTIRVFNKADKMSIKSEDGINVSARTGVNIEKLKDLIFEMAAGTSGGGLIITNQRHYAAILAAIDALKQAIDNIENKTGDIIAVDINAAVTELGLITGKSAGDELINAIFQKFCLGK